MWIIICLYSLRDVAWAAGWRPAHAKIRTDINHRAISRLHRQCESAVRAEHRSTGNHAFSNCRRRHPYWSGICGIRACGRIYHSVLHVIYLKPPVRSYPQHTSLCFGNYGNICPRPFCSIGIRDNDSTPVSRQLPLAGKPYPARVRHSYSPCLYRLSRSERILCCHVPVGNDFRHCPCGIKCQKHRQYNRYSPSP